MTSTATAGSRAPTADQIAYEKAAGFVGRIRRVLGTPGDRAALRSGLRRPPEQARRMHRLVAPSLPDNMDSATERAYYTVAAMMAAGPRPRSEPDREAQPADANERGEPGTSPPVKERHLGRCLALAVTSGALGRDAAEAHLHLLVRQSLNGVHRHLPAVVRRLQAANIPIDWVLLLRDLVVWQRRRDEVAKRWMQGFYRTLPRDPDDDGTARDDDGNAITSQTSKEDS